jgi:selenocysteine lyase/cysteine desulfurase
MVLKELDKIVNAIVREETIFVLDGYHGFMAIPTDLSKFEDRIFYLAGSYKYAQGGEGCCFLHSPKNNQFRPLYTGWFAGLSNLGSMSNAVDYPDDGLRFAGSTLDFTALYRLNAVLKLFKNEGITVEKIHHHIMEVQRKFLDHIIPLDHFYISEKNILNIDYKNHGHFFTFAMPSNEITKRLHDDLRNHKIYTDYRGSKLRFGFGLYHDGNYDLKYLKDQRKI